MFSKSLYSRLASGDKIEQEGQEIDQTSVSDGSLEPPQVNKRFLSGPGLLLAINAAMLVLSIATLTSSIAILRNSNRNNDMNGLLKQTSFFSPLLDRHPLPLKDVFVNNTIFEPSIYRQFPSPEVDDAWSKVAAFGLTTISPSDVKRLGKDPTLTVHHPDDPEAHLAIVSVNHEIHCLNDLRQNLHPDYYFPHGFKSPLHWDHVYHCLHLILQTLQCHSDVDIITYNWMESQEFPVPDFSYNMKCRDFDGLKKWQDETMMPVEEMRWKRQGGEIDVPAWPRLLELNEEEARQKAKEGTMGP